MLCTDRAELLSAAVLSDSLLRNIVLPNWLWHELLTGNRDAIVLRRQVQNSERERSFAMQAVGSWFVLQPVRFFMLRTVCSIM